MMYRKFFIPLICLYCISLSLFADESIIDLRQSDWPTGKVHTLEGNWDFYWQQLISPEQFLDNQTKPVSFPVPGAWNSAQEGTQSFPGFGYATYKTSILIPKTKTDIYLAIPDMASAYKLWSNGKVVAQNGIIGTSKATETPAYLPKSVLLTPNQGKLELVLQTSNFHYQWGGVWYPLKLTDAQGIYTLREFPIIRSMLSATILIAAGCFGLFMFFSRPKEKVLLYFSLLCLAMGLRRLLIDERIIYFAFGEHWSFLQALENLTTYLAFPFFISYFSYKFPVTYSAKAIRLSWLMVSPFCLLAIISDVSFYTRFNVPFQIMILLSLPYIYYIYIKCLKEGRQGAKTFGFGLGIFILAVLNDILTYSYVIHTPNLSHLGILAFVIFQGIDLAKSYLHSFAKIEVMSKSLQSKNQELMKIDAFKDEFLATTSHELRTPLHGISGLAKHLSNDTSLNLNPEHQHKLNLISSTTRRLGSLVNDIVDFSSIKHNNLKLNIKCIDLSALSHSVVGTLKPLVAGRDIRLTCKIPKEAQFVLADENRLQQILFNLLGNAIKFTEEGIIQVNAYTTETDSDTQQDGEGKQQVTIEIIDTGIGIALDKHDLLFEPFQHFGEPSDSLYSGSGLGLSISRQLVRLHGGELHIKSQEASGTTVTFSLPAPPSSVVNATGTQALNDTQALSLDELESDQHTHKLITQGSWLKQTTLSETDNLLESASSKNKSQFAANSVDNSIIFVVDDEEVNLELVHAQLSSQGYNTECFSCGKAVLARLTKQRPDLILLDLMMPTISGLDVCRTIRERFDSYELPIMMLTARYQVSDIVDCLSAGANDYLIKPYHEKELLARVYSQLSARKFWISQQENQTLKKEIDHRKQLQDELSLANSRLLHALDITDESILLLNESLEIIYANQPALLLLKTQNEMLLGTQLSKIISADSNTQLEDLVTKTDSGNTDQGLTLSTQDTYLGEVEFVIHPFQEKGEQYFAFIIYQNKTDNGLSSDQGIPNKLIQSLTEELAHSRRKFGQIEQALKQISSINQQSTLQPIENKDIEAGTENQYRRDLLVKLLRETINIWESYTHKTKADLAEESRCWRVYIDGTTAKTRTLDRYLSERTLPVKPRWQLVIRTAKYVLDNCELKQEDNQALSDMITALDNAFE